MTRSVPLRGTPGCAGSPPTPPGMLSWRDEQCEYVTADAVVPLLPTMPGAANLTWWVTTGRADQ